MQVGGNRMAPTCYAINCRDSASRYVPTMPIHSRMMGKRKETGQFFGERSKERFDADVRRLVVVRDKKWRERFMLVHFAVLLALLGLCWVFGWLPI